MKTNIRTVGILAVMTVCGVVNLVGGICGLMDLAGSRGFGYDHYGDRALSSLVPALVGFVVPGILGWYLDKRRVMRLPFMLGLMLVCGFAIAFAWAFILQHSRL